MIRILVKAFLLIIAACTMYAVNLGVQTPSARPLGVGEIAPDFTLEDHHGHKMTLAESRGKSPVVLVFYRGYW